ncbi:hypothetical protein BCR33DRAFT_735178 [Rhizoclosmatium globosum]|uniref:Uncharacterized protein n=1 Tax=Rhizoclosmatium globosum TaxID=329046 RepID=A0A1Y2CPQ6_9FUNG|nr:hypothetical protein BCR33DRAFT_735178 [Rhizoclosmatium globosum]|eukprot:ORY48992.1 hypothetical protein BCR33DRAFT_735178 [Rhizoclosmatium globosum]
MVQQVADLISNAKPSMDTSLGSFKRNYGAIGQEEHNNAVLPDWRQDFSCSIDASEPSVDLDENTLKPNWKNLSKKDAMKQGIMASHLKSDSLRLSSTKQPTSRVQGMIDSLVRQPSSHYFNANGNKRRNSNDSVLSKSHDLKSTSFSLTRDETTKIFPSKLIQQKNPSSTASIEDASEVKHGSKQFTNEEKPDTAGFLAFPYQSIVEKSEIRNKSSLDNIKYGKQDRGIALRLENENFFEPKTSQNVVSSIDRHFVSMKNTAKQSELSNELRMSSREKNSSMEGELEFETSSSCSVAVSSSSMTSQTSIPNEAKITIHTTVPIKIESKNYENGDSRVLETQNSESLQVPHFQALPSHNLEPGESFSKSSLSRRASVAILGVIRQVGTTATYTEKGSLAVLEDDNSISLIESEIVESETIWNTGFNPLSMFSVNWDFIIACEIFINELYQI